MTRPKLGLLALVIAGFGLAATPARAAVSDRNHDKIADDLGRQLSAARRVPILVSLRAPATIGRLTRIQQSVGSLDRLGALHIVRAFSAKATPAQIRALARRPDVAEVEEDGPVVPFSVAAESSFGIAQAQAQIPGLDGRGEVAAVIDSGIDPTMADLAGKIVGWKDVTSDRDTPYDDLGHGSLVSDVIAGSGATGPEGRGVAPGADLVGVKVVDASNQSSLSLIAQGIQWAVDNRDRYGIDLINLSIGDPNGCGDGKDVASQAVDAAVAAGIVVVAAAGNSGPAACTVKNPAAAESALTVGAMADTGAGGFANAWFSSRGPTADGRRKPDVSAPGVGMQIARPGGGYVTGAGGTSFAAPFVAGTVLLMQQADPALTPAQVKDVIERTALDWGVPGPDDDYGAGRLDAYAALQAVGAALAVPPAEPAHTTWMGTLSPGQSVERRVDVAGPAFPLAVTMTGPPITDANFDLTLLDPGGRPEGTGLPQYQASRQEDLGVPAPTAGSYTVRITATAGSGDFVADVSGALAPADTTSPALALDAPAARTRDATPALSGTAGGALGDFPGVVATVRQGDQVVRRIAAQPLLGRWSGEIAPALPEGDYTVEAEQGDAAGNVTRTPAQGFTVDTTPPTVTVTATAGSTTATFGLTTSEPATVQCRLDDGGWSACDRSVTYGSLPAGPHVFEAQPTDAAGNVGPVERRSWTVQAPSQPPAAEPAPAPVVTPQPAPTSEPCSVTLQVPRQRLAVVLRHGLVVVLRASRACTVRLTATFAGKALVRRSVAAGLKSHRVTLALSPAARHRLQHRGRAAVTVTARSTGARTVTGRLALR